MNPPKEKIERMLADGPFGVMVSMVCLGAVVAVKRGEPVESIESIKSLDPAQPVPPEVTAELTGLVKRCYALFQHATPDELDCAIALYTAHLRAAGYNVEVGYDN